MQPVTIIDEQGCGYGNFRNEKEARDLFPDLCEQPGIKIVPCRDENPVFFTDIEED